MKILQQKPAERFGLFQSSPIFFQPFLISLLIQLKSEDLFLCINLIMDLPVLAGLALVILRQSPEFNVENHPL
jgi:hypothetical protein